MKGLPIYRKLKDYIYKSKSEYVNSTTSIFGTLDSDNIEFCYKDENGIWTSYTPDGKYLQHDHDFLLEKYVRGIVPTYEIISNKIVPKLRVTLGDDNYGN